jgi:hypothetical protein
MSARKPLGAPQVNTLRGRRGPSHAFAGMPSCGAPSGSHESVHSNVYACSAGNDMPPTLYVRNALRLARFTYSNRVHDSKIQCSRSGDSCVTWSLVKPRCDTPLQYCCRRDQPRRPHNSWRDSAAGVPAVHYLYPRRQARRGETPLPRRVTLR